MSRDTETRRGTLMAAAAYLLWGIFPFYFKWLHAVPAAQILANRMVWSLVAMGALLALQRRWDWLRGLASRPRVLAGFAASAVLVSLNWGIYIWSVNAGHVVDASLGYFINPLVSVLLGALFLHERLRPGQWAALALAALGVAELGWHAGSPPWIGLSLALSFGLYGLLRKTAALGAIEGLALETALMFPFALAYLAWETLQGGNAGLAAPWSVKLLLLAAGPITAIPLLLFAAGARLIPLTRLGVLQYIAPLLQWLIGVLVYHEAFDGAKALGFGAIWTALLLYSLEGAWRNLRRPLAAAATGRRAARTGG